MVHCRGEVVDVHHRSTGEKIRAFPQRPDPKESWIKLLETAGLDEAARNNWHAEFERLAPDAHQDFLESLGIPAEEVALIRKFSRMGRREDPARKKRTAKFGIRNTG